jgi:hypothetical protein
MPIILNKKLIFIFLVITIFAILRRVVLFIWGIPLVGSEYTRYVLIVGAIIPFTLGWYAQPIVQKIGCYALGGFLMLEWIGELTGLETVLWFEIGDFLLLGVSLISFSLNLVTKKSTK